MGRCLRFREGVRSRIERDFSCLCYILAWNVDGVEGLRLMNIILFHVWNAILNVKSVHMKI
jgi:hypothetical protein